MSTLGMCSKLVKNIWVLSPKTLNSHLCNRQLLRFAQSTTAPEATAGKTEEQPRIEEQSTTDEKTNISEIEAKFKEENDKLAKQLGDFKDKYTRSLAETENVRQRMKKQIEDTKLFGIQGFCKDLLEVADTLGKATESVPKDLVTDNNNHLKGLYDGLVMTEGQLLKVFNRHGLYQIDPEEGEKFDPDLHEALFQQPNSDKEKGDTVAAVTKTGYRLHNRTIRPALVGVYK